MGLFVHGFVVAGSGHGNQSLTCEWVCQMSVWSVGFRMVDRLDARDRDEEWFA